MSDSGRGGQKLGGFHNARSLKPIAESAGCDDKRWFRVALLERVIFAMKFRIREERHTATSQTCEQ